MKKSKGKLVAALSGGVDSSVAAALCQQQGYELIGVTLRLRSCDDTTEKRKSCCGADDNIQAGLVAGILGIPHYFHDAKTEFKQQVLRYAWSEYAAGRTPNPCIMCNNHIKFGALWEFAEKIGAEGIVTGHYSRLHSDSTGDISLLRGIDTIKDQTYFLAFLTREQLRFTHFPLGGMTKPEVRKLATEFGLPNAAKKESQDACFGYKGESFPETLRQLFTENAPQGNIVDETGKILKPHQGIHDFTIGKRKGLGIALGKPAYVVDINNQSGDITLSTNSDLLLSHSLLCSGFNWLIEPPKKLTCQLQVRYNQQPINGIFEQLNETQGKVTFIDPVRAVSPGQAVVFYDNDRVLGGAWIDQAD
jgi:tRNA-specific 2-thiouridylase